MFYFGTSKSNKVSNFKLNNFKFETKLKLNEKNVNNVF